MYVHCCHLHMRPIDFVETDPYQPRPEGAAGNAPPRFVARPPGSPR